MSNPPRLARWFVTRCLPPGPRGASIAGDLTEEYHRIHGPIRRNLWFVLTGMTLGSRYAAVRLNRRFGKLLGKQPGNFAFDWTSSRDVRGAWRVLRRHPGHASLVVTILALSIGTTTAIFSIVDRVLLQPLPYDRPSELVTVWNTYPGWQDHAVLSPYWDRISLSWPEYVDWREDQTSFDAVGVYGGQSVALTGTGDPLNAFAGLASTSLFPMLGARTVVGRAFLPGEEGPNAPRLVILTYGLWQSRFGGDTAIVSNTILLDDTPYSVIGVLPRDFRVRYVGPFSGDVPQDLWVPIGAASTNNLGRGDHQYTAIGRLRDGVSYEQAVAEANPLIQQETRVVSRKAEETRSVRRPLLLLLASVFLLLLIGCGNVAALQVGDVSRRRHELATRAVLGARTTRIVRQLLTENIILGLVGSLIGLGVAELGINLLVQFIPPEISVPTDVGIDLRVLVFSAVIGTAAGVAFGMIPAFVTARENRQLAIRNAAPGARSSGWRGQQIVMAGEIALAVMLLISAGLLTRSLRTLTDVDPGFNAERLITIQLDLPTTRYVTGQELGTVVDQLTTTLEAVPGVSAVAVANAVPFSGTTGSSSFMLEGHPVPPGEKQPEAYRRNVTPSFHETYGMRLLAGRWFSEGDRAEGPATAIVSEAMARMYWPDRSPIGLRIERDDILWEIVGIVGDVLRADLTGELEPTFYLPYHQEPTNSVTFTLRTDIEPNAISSSLRRAVWIVDPSLPIARVETMENMIEASYAQERFRTVLVSIFGAAAALLSALGIFAVTVRGVTARTRELGIRRAIGAREGDLVRLVLRQQSVVLVAGSILGVTGAVALSATLAPFLFGIPARDPATYAVAALGLGVLGLIAAYLPARQAGRLDPNDVLRLER